MEYLTAWIVVGVAGLAALAGVFVLSRKIPWPLPRTIVRCLAAVFLLVPAPIGVLDGFYAPAFVVAVFEGLFRDGGSAQPALTMLGLAAGAALVLVIAGYLISRRRQPASDSE
ncbi:MAG: hypothetical protein NXH85_18500 [Pseudomonadaceae bacterium]|nr:hypothetical protein [Pseudomonadaceae bacterium]